ncbi:MAG TPA: glycerophosphodiester phosphodiesterase family protein [Faecalibacter sp.]
MRSKYLKFNHLYLTLLAIALIWSCNPSHQSKKNEQVLNQNEFDFNYSSKEKNLVSAHRGGSGIENYPENCIETMNYLFEQGIQIFEIDVAKTKDHQLILMHDNSLQRTSTGRQDVNQITLDRIKEYFLVDDFGNQTSYKIPTFTEALQWGKSKPIYFMVDIKKDVDYRQLIEEIRTHQMEKQVVLVSYSVQQAKKLHQLAPEMLLSVSMRNEREFNDMMQSGIPPHQMVAFTGTRRSSDELYRKIHQQNIMVILGTLGNIDKSAAARGNNIYQELEQQGVDIFATDRALEVYHTINKN